ncbi:MFS general substrate transporter [Xylariaceae sp. FL0662B]|nr:MFS general substrate transporter [Xylariaceae sp. FL0662B]
MVSAKSLEEKSQVEHNDAVLLENKSDGSLEAPSWTAEEEAAVRRKLDWQIVPTVTLMYLLNFLDRINIGNARIQGLEKDVGLVGYQFNIATSIFYIVYSTTEVPSNIVLKRVGPRFYLPSLVVLFGIVSLATGFVNNFNQLCAVRALLGIFEGGIMPGIAFLLSSFYKREELYFRVGIYVSSASIAGSFGGLLAAGLTRIPEWGAAGARLHTWRNIFFFEGLITIIVGLLAPLALPQTPASAKSLTDREKWIATERILIEHKANPKEKVQPHHIKRAFFNINNWICAGGFFFVNISVQGLSVFMPTILRELGWESMTAQYFTVPVYAAAGTIAIAVGLISDKTRMRGLYLALFTFLGITGFAILRWGSGNALKYAAVYLCAVGAFPGGPGFLSWALNNAAGPSVRAVSGGWIVGFGGLGGIAAVWAYLPNDGPSFPIGHTINLTTQILALFLSVGGIVYCLWENRVRHRGGRDGRLVGLTEEQKVDLGYRHPEFRYIA